MTNQFMYNTRRSNSLKLAATNFLIRAFDNPDSLGEKGLSLISTALIIVDELLSIQPVAYDLEVIEEKPKVTDNSADEDDE